MQNDHRQSGIPTENYQRDNSKNKNEKENKNEDKIREEIVHLKQKISELENQVKRTLADYQNLEKRIISERKDLIINANKHLLLRLLPVLDTLMFALLHTKDKGLEVAVQQFLDTLKDEGIKKIETKDKMFDPKLMECIEVTIGEDYKVISEVLPGYLLNEEVLRPAKVKVGKKNIEKKGDKLIWEK